MSNKEQLEVKSVDLVKGLETLGRHHTNRFELSQHKNPTVVVLRRGQASQWVIIFSRHEYDPKKDIVELIFTFGNYPKIEDGTKGVAIVTSKEYTDGKLWHAKLISNYKNSLVIEIHTPPKIPVGEWKFVIETKPVIAIKGTESRPTVFEYPKPIYLLFNPWIPSDQVYMNDASLLNEYVLNNVGKIWLSKEDQFIKWDFNQFDEIVLPLTLTLLEKASIEPSQRGNAVDVTRAISRILNSDDNDDGVLEGRWDGSYGNEVPPFHWTSSIPILQQYLDSTHFPVKYGQCWVFAGLVTTVCRALGIPCRVVTNFTSGRDRDGNLAIDHYYFEDGTVKIPETSKDFYWNFHVWNDVWMARPDLPPGYGGWQAIDATPQEISKDLKQCGPASLEAIRRGEVKLDHDVAFMLASVNGDVVNWNRNDSVKYGFFLRETDKNWIGKNIVTKKPGIFEEIGNSDIEVITHLYKNKENTIEERLAILNGAGAIKKARKIYNIPDESSYDVDFQLTIIKEDEIKFGDIFTIAIDIHNKSSEGRKIQALLSASSSNALGIKVHNIKDDTTELEVAAGSTETFKLYVYPEDYVNKLVDKRNVKIYASATVVDTNQIWAREMDFLFPAPGCFLEVKETPFANKPFLVHCRFQNPLEIPLTNCKLQLKISESTKEPDTFYYSPLSQKEVDLAVRFTSQRAGNHHLVGTFSSNELVDLRGFIDVQVFEPQGSK